MDILELIRTRRSIRKFIQDDINDETIDKFIEAARWAPSGLNNQPWRFIIIRNQSKKEQLSKFTKYNQIIEDAPLLIVVFLDHNSSYDRTKDVQAIGACIQNILLTAHYLEFGSCWLGEILNNREKVERLLEVPESLESMAVVALGLPVKKITEGYRKPKEQMIISHIN